MKLRKIHWIGIILGIVALAMDFLFFSPSADTSIFLFLFGIAIAIIVAPFVIDIILQNEKETEINAMFLEFSRNLSESVATGTPISKSIINMKNKNLGQLTPFVQKLANQIELGIPVNKALSNFSMDTGSQVIGRAVSLIIEAERAGGDINYILESVAKSISEVEKLKKERQAAIYGLVVQGYIIFFIFIGIMLIMQYKIIPLIGSGTSIDLSKITSIASSLNSSSTNALQNNKIGDQFLYLLIAQGFFAGLTIGKLAEGSIRAGIKHSFILVIVAFLVSMGARVLFS